MGDRNTKYFHALASTRRRTKAVTKLVHQGQEVTDQSGINQLFLSHFKALLGSSRPIQLLDLRALYDQHTDLQHLDAPFTTSEVQKAVKELADNKASGPDGLPNEFAKQQWEHLRPHVMQIFYKLFAHQTDLTGINQAAIVLIPKHDTPTLISDFRPISVINLIPKLISKVLANRIRPYMSQLVDEHQTAFIRGRLIAENFLVTREVLQHVHRAGSPAIMLKTDFAKAYDTLEWPFLLQVLKIRGFPQKMLLWISHMLHTATSIIKVNGTTSAPFTHKRGLRQGDPLSPYLFVLAADVLQRMTKNVSIALPAQLTPKVPFPILNFQYADDTIFIASTRGQTLRALILTIHCFSEASGLKVNLEKSVFVPLSVQANCMQPIQQLLQCTQQALPITYLGMPLTLTKPTRTDYRSLIEKLEKRLEGWKACFLSRAGRLQLIKSVISSIPTYYMSCFKFPKWLLDRIDVIRRHFLWNRGGNDRPVHLLNWQSVCLPIECWGMGVVNLQLQNMALLLRWLWRIYAPDRKLWATFAAMIHGTRNQPDGPLFLASSGPFFWKALMKLKHLFHCSVTFLPGSGKRISFWFDKWDEQILASTIIGAPRFRRLSLYDAKGMVDQLFPAPLTPFHLRIIQSLNMLTNTQGRDGIKWNLTNSGLFSVKSIYKILSQGGKERADITVIWKAAVTPSMRLFAFLFLRGRLLTHEVMQRRNMVYQPGCLMCDSGQEETTMHLFFSCSYANHIWSALTHVLGYAIINPKESPILTFRASYPSDKDRRRSWLTMFITALWYLWRQRNERTFRNSRIPCSVLTDRIRHEAELYLRYC